jgi:hypothetical protein
MNNTEKLIITPHTKLLQLLETFPKLESVILSLVPSLDNLKNPALRKTVAGVATLHQIAGVANMNVAELINILRKEIGQDTLEELDDTPYNPSKPAWFNEQDIIQEFDVREMLAIGEHPVGQVMSDLSSFPNGKIYKLIAPFLPAPLIDKASSLGFNHWITQESEDLFNVYFLKE